jgi:hypothetical protein
MTLTFFLWSSGADFAVAADGAAAVDGAPAADGAAAGSSSPLSSTISLVISALQIIQKSQFRGWRYYQSISLVKNII